MTDDRSRHQGKSGKKPNGSNAGKDLETMELNVALSTDEIIRGLKHYKRIARQDMLQAGEFDDAGRASLHAECRREVYSHLAEFAEAEPAAEVVREALRLYRELPFVTGTPEDSFVDIKGRENALENFFLMINLEPRIRREVRSQRSRIQEAQG